LISATHSKDVSLFLCFIDTLLQRVAGNDMPESPVDKEPIYRHDAKQTLQYRGLSRQGLLLGVEMNGFSI